MRTGKYIKGFTLLELMITLAIVGIVAAIAVPSMTSMVNNSKAERITGLFKQDLQFARSYAISRGEVVRMTAIDGGWQIVAETTGDTLRTRDILDDTITLTSTNGLNSVAFTATGQIESTDTITIRTSGCTGNEDKSFSLLRSGQIAETELTCVTQ
ncbi:MAG: type II secretion system protein H [Marinomonas primoryensis]|jgi:type II secretion system protein H